MRLWDAFKRKILKRDVEEMLEAVEEGEPFIPNRAMRRAALRASCKRGPGWTRPMRKGRKSDA